MYLPGTGDTCLPVRSYLLSQMVESFSEPLSPSRWARVDGLGSEEEGCGPLLPHGHGPNLYFDGCGLRQAITTEMDLSRVRSVVTDM